MIVETPPETNRVYGIGVHGRDIQHIDVWKCQTVNCWNEVKINSSDE